jgi:hypothetical protein
MIYPTDILERLKIEFQHDLEILDALDKGESVESLVRKAFEVYAKLYQAAERTLATAKTKDLSKKEEKVHQEFKGDLDYWKGKQAMYGEFLLQLAALKNSQEDNLGSIH